MIRTTAKRNLSRFSTPWLVTLLTLATSCATGLRVEPPIQIQTWVAYFDADRGMAEVQEHGFLFDRISLFAFELSPDGTPVPAPNVAGMIPRFLQLAQESGFAPWITVVNDVRFGGDSASQKDANIIHGLLSDPMRRSRHARALAEAVSIGGFSGLHLDYERVAESDSAEFRALVAELLTELGSRELGLEVVLEPSRGPLPSPMSTNVSVMGYDLHGPHSGPGPRATPEFVSGLVRRAKGDTDSAAGLALAVAGFAWEPGGAVEPLDWAAARSLASHAPVSLRSDSDDVPGARLDDGTELWFEDPGSVLTKWDAAWKSGFRRLLLWRLGGNDERLFDMLKDLRQGAVQR